MRELAKETQCGNMKKLSCGCIVDEKGKRVKLCEWHDYIEEAKRIMEEIMDK